MINEYVLSANKMNGVVLIPANLPISVMQKVGEKRKI